MRAFFLALLLVATTIWLPVFEGTETGISPQQRFAAIFNRAE